MTLSLPPLPAAFATASQSWPLAAQQTLANVRRVVHAMCTGCDAAPLQETLKWGEPSWLPRAPRIGTTLRAAWKPQRPDHFGLFVHCQTSIAAEFDALYPPHSGPRFSHAKATAPSGCPSARLCPKAPSAIWRSWPSPITAEPKPLRTGSAQINAALRQFSADPVSRPF